MVFYIWQMGKEGPDLYRFDETMEKVRVSPTGRTIPLTGVQDDLVHRINSDSIHLHVLDMDVESAMSYLPSKNPADVYIFMGPYCPLEHWHEQLYVLRFDVHK